ncbi:MAG: hypothetical protein OXI30_03020 [Chloroflexota bacterium]|nr:hypothetical protein [Chloroflexota bacterium]
MMTRREHERQYREAVMEDALAVLQDGQPRTAKAIAWELRQYYGWREIRKSAVNSVLSNEAARYVNYDRQFHTYEIRQASEATLTASDDDRLAKMIDDFIANL